MVGTSIGPDQGIGTTQGHGASPLSEGERRDFAKASEQARSIFKAERAAAFNGWTTRTHPISGLGELEALVGPVEDLARTLATFVYGSVIVLTAVFQGLMARFHFARVGMMEAYLEDTPAWVVDLQRAGREGTSSS